MLKKIPRKCRIFLQEIKHYLLTISLSPNKNMLALRTCFFLLLHFFIFKFYCI